MKKHEGASMAVVGKEIANMWKKASSSEKAPLEKKAAADKKASSSEKAPLEKKA